MVLEIKYRTLSDLDAADFYGYHDTLGVLGLANSKKAALKADPFIYDKQQTAQIIGVVGQDIAGGLFVFPIGIVADGEQMIASAGTTLTVLKPFRWTGLGLELPELALDTSQDKIGLGAGLSQMALPVHEFCGYAIFRLPRYIALRKSRSLVQKFLPFKMVWASSLLFDCALDLYWMGLARIVQWHLQDYSIETVSASDETALRQVESILCADSHRFSEVHNMQWFIWHMTQAFVEKGGASVWLVRSQGCPVAFFMTKKRFHAQASHRGFKNIWLGSVIEWGCMPEFRTKMQWLILRAMLSLGKSVDAIEIATDDVHLKSFLKNFGLRRLGDSNFVIKADKDSPLLRHKGWDVQLNWRLRPAMGDNGMS